MTKLSLSKIPSAFFSTAILISFCLGIIFGAVNQKLFAEFILSTFCLVAFSFFIFIKIRSAYLLLAISLGIIFVNYVELGSIDTKESGCFDAVVKSSAKKFQRGFIYKVAISNSKQVIFLDDEQFAVSDKIQLCIGEKKELEPKDERYILSQFKKEQIYLVYDTSLKERGRGMRRLIFDLSQSFRKGSAEIFTGDKGVLAHGLLFGSSGEFSSEMKTKLKKSGTSHLVAVSGYNVSIITSWLFTTLRYISKTFAGVSSVVILALFYFLTAGSASVLRASIMGCVVLASRFIGRKVMSIHLLALAATIIFLLNPFAFYDWGFQLSFLATAGLFFLSPSLETVIDFRQTKSMLVKIFCETLGAQIFVLPILAVNFGQFSLIAPVSNLLVLPFISLAMLLVALSLLGFFIYPGLGLFFGGLAGTILSYIMQVIKITGSFKFASVNLEIHPLIGLVVGYAGVFALTILLRRYLAKRENRQNF